MPIGTLPPTPPPAHRAAPHRAQGLDLEATSNDTALGSDYSPRAKRRLAHLLRLEMYELQAARLERVKAAVERGLSGSALFDDVTATAPRSMRCSAP